jgi:tetratricopeptide (TPR) repeat protein
VGKIAELKYRAFLSYAHADTAWARWLHARLESFAIDKDLVGRDTARGPVPKTLRPIFRDREDFSGGHSLTDATVAALDASAGLVVLCSPISATRPAVNEEVRLFHARHPDRPVIPVIVAGTWPDNFPPALRFELNADGSVSDRPITILGPNLREPGDGKSLGLAKIVAGLTGLSPDDVYHRAERARRRQNRLRTAFGAVFLAITLAGGFFYWQSYQQKATLAEISALVDKYSVVTPAQAAAPGAREGLTQAITAIADGSATDRRYARALELLKAGKPAEAEPLLRAVAEEKARRAEKDARDAAAAYRNLASIAAVSEPGRAREYYGEAARLDPSNVAGMLRHAFFQEKAGQLNAAQDAYARVLAMAKPGSDDRAIFWSKIGTGDIQRQRGNLGAALAIYQDAATIADRLAKANPGNAGWQFDLGASNERIGDVLVRQGDLAGALKSFKARHDVIIRLAKAAPGNAAWQRDLAVSYDKVGDVQVAQGDLAGALTSYRDGLAIRDRLAKADPRNARSQRDLSVSLSKIGNVQMAQGDLVGALTSYRDSLTIKDRLAKADPGDAGAQRDLSLSYDKVGDVQRAQGDLVGALTSYRDGLAIREPLAKTDPGNADWQRDLSISYERVGNVQMAQGDLVGALASYRDSLAILDRLAKSDRSNAGWQRDLSVALIKVGDVQRAQGDLTGALASYRDRLAIAERLAKADPGNAGWQRGLSISYERIGDVQMAQGDLAGALASYRDSLAIKDQLAKADPSNAGWQRGLAVSYRKLATVHEQLGDTAQALTELRKGRDIIAALVSIAPTHAQWKKDIASFDRRIARLENSTQEAGKN